MWSVRCSIGQFPSRPLCPSAYVTVPIIYFERWFVAGIILYWEHGNALKLIRPVMFIVGRGGPFLTNVSNIIRSPILALQASAVLSKYICMVPIINLPI